MTSVGVLEKQRLYKVVNPDQDLTFEARFKQNFEEKDYLVCLSIISSDELLTYESDWRLCHGRTEAYEYIKDRVSFNESDLHPLESFILVDGLPLKDRKNIYAFMKYVQGFYDDGFDIDDYIDIEDYMEPNLDSTNNRMNPPTDIYKILNTGLTMEEFMNGTHFFQMPLPKDGDE